MNDLREIQNTKYFHISDNAGLVWEEIKYRSKHRPISAYQITINCTDFSWGISQPFVWGSVYRIVKQLKKNGAPIGSNAKGYFNSNRK